MEPRRGYENPKVWWTSTEQGLESWCGAYAIKPPERGEGNTWRLLYGPARIPIAEGGNMTKCKLLAEDHKARRFGPPNLGRDQ